MKNLKLLIVLLLLISFSNQTAAQVMQEEKLGLIFQLIKIKCGAENRMEIVMGNERISAEDKKEIIKKHNTIRDLMNSIIYQLMTDMRANNSAKKLKRLNRFYRHYYLNNPSGGLIQYKNAFAKLYNEYSELKDYKFTLKDTKKGEVLESSKSIGFADLGITEAVTTAWTILKENSELREKKVSNLISILEKLMIDSYTPTEKKTKTITETTTKKNSAGAITEETVKEEKTVITSD